MEQKTVELKTIDTEPRRAGAHWSLSEIQTVIEGTDKSLEDLADELGRSAQAISDRKYNLGLLKGNPGPRARRVNHWMPEEIETLKREWRKGKSAKEIASILGRSCHSIHCKKGKLKLGRRFKRAVDIGQIRENYDAGIPCGQIAKKFGVSRRYVEDLCRKRPLKLSVDEIEIIEERYGDGCTCACIARRLRRHTTTVHKYIQKNDLVGEPQSLDDLVEELIKHGLSVGQVAIKLELPRRSITCAIERIKRAKKDA